MVTSLKSNGKIPIVLSKTRETSAMPTGRRCVVPEKMTSSIFTPRRDLALCSPKTQRTASATLLFPLPFGPTMTLNPWPNSNLTRSANDLNP